MTYNKSATFLTTLQRLIGNDAMDETMKTYFERWKFKHPCSRDLIAVVNEVVRKHYGDKFGKDMQWYFDQVLYGTDVCDYELSAIINQPVFGKRGLYDSAGTKITPREKYDPAIAQKYECRVLVTRLGEVKMPVDVLVHFKTGEEVREHWAGRDRWKEFKYVGTEKVLWAKVDPDDVLAIDINVNNNSKTTEALSQPIWKYTVKFLYWVQNVLQYSSLF